MHIKELRCVANLNCGPISHPPRRLHFCPIYTATCIYRQELSIAVHYAVHYFSSYCRPHKYTRARAHTHTHTHTHTVVAQPRGTHFLRLTQKLRRKRQSRGKQIKKKESSKESALPFTKRERYGDIYTLYGKREEKKERERERK